MIQSRADSKGQPAFLSFPAMDRIMQNLDGESFNYEGFKMMYDATPAIADIVKNFDEDGITIDTKEGGEKDAPQGGSDPQGDGVNSAATRAAKKGLGKDL
jgi:hypothetical protein